jgi:hypothetical protein
VRRDARENRWVQRQLPTGTVTFLFTDIEGSTRLLRDEQDEEFKRRTLTSLRLALTPERLAAELAAGAALSLDEAIDLALGRSGVQTPETAAPNAD